MNVSLIFTLCFSLASCKLCLSFVARQVALDFFFSIIFWKQLHVETENDTDDTDVSCESEQKQLS